MRSKFSGSFLGTGFYLALTFRLWVLKNKDTQSSAGEKDSATDNRMGWAHHWQRRPRGVICSDGRVWRAAGGRGWRINWALKHSYFWGAGRGLQQQKYILSQFRRLQAWDQGVAKALPSQKTLGEETSLPLPASGGCWQFWAFLGWKQHHSNLCLSSLRVSVSEFPLSYKDTSRWIRARDESRKYPYIFSVQTVLFPTCGEWSNFSLSVHILPLVSYSYPNCTRCSGMGTP